MPSNRTAAQILAEWHARNNTCPPGVECEHHGPMATDEPDCAECWLAAAEKRAKASEEGAECMTDLLMLETPLSERDVAALHAWQAQQSRRVAEAEAAAWAAAEAARAAWAAWAAARADHTLPLASLALAVLEGRGQQWQQAIEEARG